MYEANVEQSSTDMILEKYILGQVNPIITTAFCVEATCLL